MFDPVINLYAEAWRAVCLAGWRWARRDLQKKNPAHPALPEVILNIRRLER